MKDNSNKIIYIFLAISIVLFLIVGSTLAYFSWTSGSSESTAISFTLSDNLSCSADGGGNITSSNTQLAPATCTDSEHAIQRTITTSVTNDNGGSAYLSLSLKVNQMASELAASENFKYALTTNATSCTTGVLESGTFTGATANSTFTILEDQEYQTSPATGTYYLYIWLDEAESNNNTQNKTFNLSLTGVCTNQAPSSIVSTIAENAVIDNTSSTYVTNANGIQFNAISSDTNGKGLYIRAGTQNDAHPIYYYRGAVDNNNVLFAGFCWKIVRTTSTGGTKLIYNGLPSGTNNNECTNTTGTDTQLATISTFNSNYKSPADVGYMYGTRYEYLSKTMTSLTDTYMYGTGYDENTHKLVTTNAMNFAGTDWGTYYNQLNNNHYTCFNTTGECNQVYYIYYTLSTKAYYVQIPSGKTISGMLDEMLTSSTNEHNSTIKTAIDTWYAANMTSYTSKLEDTPYCNDRTIYELGGWSPTGSTTSLLYFSPYGRAYSTYTPSLTCNTNDAFTVSNSNGNGKLTYPVGLLTADEIRLAGGKYGANNSTYYLYTNQNWWSWSPDYFSNGNALEFVANSMGNLNSNYVNYVSGVRPAVSLKPGTKFSSGGDGTSTNPYVVE